MLRSSIPQKLAFQKIQRNLCENLSAYGHSRAQPHSRPPLSRSPDIGDSGGQPQLQQHRSDRLAHAMQVLQESLQGGPVIAGHCSCNDMSLQDLQ